MPSKNYELVTINAPDPKLFFPKYLPHPDRTEKFKLISSSWSTNPKKGFDILEHLDSHLDFNKYEMTFIGRSPVNFRNIKLINSLPSLQLAEHLRNHHFFVSASFREACSNSLLEAMHCGCVPIARNNSSHPEIIADAGVLFEGQADILTAIERAAENYEEFKAKNILPSIQDVGERYFKFCTKVHEGKDTSMKNFSFVKAISFIWSEIQFKIEQRLG